MLYSIRNLVKTRARAKGYCLLVRNLQIPRGARIALTGPSGCGKSTLLDILGLSLAPDSSEEFVFEPADKRIDVTLLWQERRFDELAALRGTHVGYVLQTGELLPFLTAGENMLLAASIAGRKDGVDAAHSLATRLGVESLWKSMPATLSVGERQRCAIVRALAAQPDIILADEPTAALDPLHADKVMDVFLSCIKDSGSALIIATHNAEWAIAGGLARISFSLVEEEDRVVSMIDGTEK